MAKAELEVVESADEINEILNAFNAAAGKSEDDVKMEMIKAGATFKNVTRLYNQYMIDTGQAMSADQKKDILDSNLEGKDLSTEDSFKKAAGVIAAKGTNVSDASAASLVRAWAKKAEVECYKAPTGSGNARNPFIPNYHAALIANPMMTEDGLKKVIDDLEKDEWKVNPTRWFNQQNAIRKMVNKVAESLA